MRYIMVGKRNKIYMGVRVGKLRPRGLKYPSLPNYMQGPQLNHLSCRDAQSSTRTYKDNEKAT